MKRLTSKISIGNYSFFGVINVKIESSWGVLTDTCEITIPRKLSFKGREIATGDNPLFKKGDKVVIEESRPLSRDKRWIAISKV